MEVSLFDHPSKQWVIFIYHMHSSRHLRRNVNIFIIWSVRAPSNVIRKKFFNLQKGYEKFEPDKSFFFIFNKTNSINHYSTITSDLACKGN